MLGRIIAGIGAAISIAVTWGLLIALFMAGEYGFWTSFINGIAMVGVIYGLALAVLTIMTLSHYASEGEWPWDE